MFRRSLRLVFAIPFVACGGSLPHPPYAPQATSALAPVEFAPPPGRIETIPEKPAGADAWVDGEWVYRHGRWFWLLGRWVKTPPGARYSPWVCVRAADAATYCAPSAWRDAKGAPMEAPPAQALATASGEAVFDPAGDVENTGRNLKTAPPQRRPTEDRPSPTP